MTGLLQYCPYLNILLLELSLLETCLFCRLYYVSHSRFVGGKSGGMGLPFNFTETQQYTGTSTSKQALLDTQTKNQQVINY